MAKIQKPKIIDGPHGLRDSTEEWTQDDFTLYEMLQIVEQIEKIRNDWLSGEADSHSVTMSHWVMRHALDVSSKLSETLIKQQEEEGGE